MHSVNAMEDHGTDIFLNNQQKEPLVRLPEEERLAESWKDGKLTQ